MSVFPPTSPDVALSTVGAQAQSEDMPLDLRSPAKDGTAGEKAAAWDPKKTARAVM